MCVLLTHIPQTCFNVTEVTVILSLWPWSYPEVYILGEGRAKGITVTSYWMRRRLKSPTCRWFVQPFVQAWNKENIKAPRHWLLWGEFTGYRWTPLTKGKWRGNCFHLMTSSCTMNSSIKPGNPMTENMIWNERATFDFLSVLRNNVLLRYLRRYFEDSFCPQRRKKGINIGKNESLLNQWNYHWIFIDNNGNVFILTNNNIKLKYNLETPWLWT